MQKPATPTAAFGFKSIVIVENGDIWVSSIAVGSDERQRSGRRQSEGGEWGKKS